MACKAESSRFFGCCSIKQHFSHEKGTLLMVGVGAKDHDISCLEVFLDGDELMKSLLVEA